MQPALARADEGHVTDPRPVRGMGAELPIEQIRGGCRPLLMLGHHAEAPLSRGFNPSLSS